jgi:type IV pilus assembly protein PilV
VEVLVTMVVITIGLLGVAGLQMAALNNSYGTFQRSLATLQAQDLIERLWANACVIGNSMTRESIRSEWEQVQKGSGSTRVAMSDWRGLLNVTGSVYEVTISWSNDRLNKSSDSALNTQTVRQVTQIPSVSCV